MTLKDFKIPAACIAAGIAIGAFCQGQFDSSTETETTANTVSGTTTVKKETKTKVVKAPDGTETNETTVTEETGRSTEVKHETASTEVKVATSKIHIQALAGLDTTHNFAPVYGANVSKDIVGPISIGVWALWGSTITAGGISGGASF